jgi:anti-sigma regulatory factor (Ser/Thr protein kinase)
MHDGRDARVVRRWSLPKTPATPRQARHLVADTVEEYVDFELAEEIALAVAELVNNAVQHGDEPLELRVGVDDQGRLIRIEISDGSATLPQLREPSDAGGYGLHVMADLADGWGFEEVAEGGKRVWIEFRT